MAPTPDASRQRLLGDVDSLDEFEIEHFKRIAKYMKPNPRAIKRISSMYRLARLMVLSRATTLDDDERRALLRRLLVWIVLCEQWPVHMAWSLQVLEDMHQWRHLHEIGRGEEDEHGLDDPEELSFHEFYHTHVKHRVFDVHQEHCPEPLQQRYQRIFCLEHDKEIFDCLIADGFDIDFELRVEHIGTLLARDATMLISYCTNLNPALVSLLSLVKSVPQSADKEIREMAADGDARAAVPHSAFCTVTKGIGGMVARLDSKYFDRLEAANEQLDVTPIWLLCQLVARFFVAICKPMLLLGNWCAQLVRGPAFDTSSAPMLHQLMNAGAARRRRLASMHPRQITSYDYHYIWWNAWLYSGSDNLWAGLIKALHEAVEERYGAPYVRRCR